MIKLLQLLLRGHIHEWETIRQHRIEWSNAWGSYGTGVRYYLRCKKCGWVRKTDCK